MLFSLYIYIYSIEDTHKMYSILYIKKISFLGSVTMYNEAKRKRKKEGESKLGSKLIFQDESFHVKRRAVSVNSTLHVIIP